VSRFYAALRSSPEKYALIEAPDWDTAVVLAGRGLPGNWTQVFPQALTSVAGVAATFPGGCAAHLTTGPDGGVLVTVPTEDGAPFLHPKEGTL